MSFPYSEKFLKRALLENFLPTGHYFLEEEFGAAPILSTREIRKYARDIGINPNEEPDLMWLAQEGVQEPLPADWKLCLDRTGKKYFFNFSTPDFIYEHPSKESYRFRVLQERERLRAQAKDIPVKNEKTKKDIELKKKEYKDKEPIRAPATPDSGLGSSPAGLSKQVIISPSSSDTDNKKDKVSEEEDSDNSDVIVVSKAAPPEKMKPQVKITVAKKQNQCTVKKTEDKKIKHFPIKKDKHELEVPSRKGNHKKNVNSKN
ncbi:centrosomal protein of 164 kDa-like [Arapaima gigas]